MPLTATPQEPSAAETVVINALPNLPVPLKQGAGTMLGSTIYAGLGSAGQAWMSLDLSAQQPQWKALASFPGTPRDQAVAMTIGEKVFVFGGAGYDPALQRVAAFQDIHCYDPLRDTWSVWPSASPVPLLGAAVATDNGRAALFYGAINAEVFNGFARASAVASTEEIRNQVTREYLSMPTPCYRFSKAVHAFEPERDHWSIRGEWAGEPCVGSALAQNKETVYLAGGEIKPGLRSRQAYCIDQSDPSINWQPLPDIPPGNGHNPQEGLAGAMAALNGKALVLAGGTSFPGAQARYQKGAHYAHEGLQKQWHRDIFVLAKNEWRVVGQLPRGLAHALAYSWNGAVVIVGGESDGGEPRAEVLTLRLADFAMSRDRSDAELC